MFNLLSNILGKPDEESVTPEEQAKIDKQDRIKFHRERVRNGPVKFSELTSGQIRRSRARAAKSQARKTQKARVRTFFAQEREKDVLRGQLEAVGILPTTAAYDEDRHFRAVDSIIDRFVPIGRSDSTSPFSEGVQAAYDRYCALAGLPKSEIDWDELPVVRS